MAIYKDVEPLEVVAYKGGNKDFDNGVQFILEKLDALPTADVVEVKHGEWIDKPSGRYMHIASWCSACGNKSGIGGIESNRHKPYCPNCGAIMDGRRETNAE